jgi:nitrite reductase (NADH) small subunit
MSEFIRIGSKSELPDTDEAKEFTVLGKVICVANAGGRYSALDNVCLHRGGPLGQGVVMDGKVICPWHGWMFDAATGQADHPGFQVATYPLKIEGDDVYVEL